MSKEKLGADHKALLTRVNRVEGQIRGVKGMMEEGKYCVDILTQIKAARSALKSLELLILEGHVNHCLMNAVSSGPKADIEEKIKEIMELIKKSTKS